MDEALEWGKEVAEVEIADGRRRAGLRPGIDGISVRWRSGRRHDGHCHKEHREKNKSSDETAYFFALRWHGNIEVTVRKDTGWGSGRRRRASVRTPSTGPYRRLVGRRP